MIVAPSTIRTASARPRGLTLVEMVISIVLVAVLLLAALNMVGSASLGQRTTDSQRRGNQLAQDLMNEILLQPYADETDPDSFGLEGAENVPLDRSLYDDVDDYHGWSASPPERNDGTPFNELADWTRTVAVMWVDPSNLALAVGTNQGVKHITVTADRNGAIAAELVAYKTVGLPPLEACCFSDGTCLDIRQEDCLAGGGTPMGADTTCAEVECPQACCLPDSTCVEVGESDCLAQGGTPMGAGTVCASTACVASLKVLFVSTPDPGPSDPPKPPDAARIALIESWGFVVEFIDAADTQALIDAAVTRNDVAYVSAIVDDTQLDLKLRDAPIGVVNEEIEVAAEFGIAYDTLYKSRDEINILDASHYITSGFSTGTLTICTSTQPVHMLNSPYASGLQILAETFNTGSGYKRSLVVLETGAALVNNDPAAARRVQLPWGQDGFDINALNADGQTIMKRAIEWAADAVPSIGVLFVSSGGVPTALDADRIALIESWGFVVSVIADAEPQANFDAAIGAADIVYLGPSSSASAVAGKVENASIGLVNENGLMIDNLGFAGGLASFVNSELIIADPDHYVTSELSVSPVATFTSALSMIVPSSSLVAPDLQDLLEVEDNGPDAPAVAALEVGAQLSDAVGGTAPGRRIHLPFTSADVSQLTATGQTVMRRAIEWAADGAGGGAGGPAEILLASHDIVGGNLQTTSVTSMLENGTYFFPTLPPDSTSWSVTRVQLRMRKSGNSNGVSSIELRTVDASLDPTNVVLESVALNESTLQNSYEWVEFNYNTVQGLDPAQGLSIVVNFVSGASTVVLMEFEINIPDTPNTHWMTTTDGGAYWKAEAGEMRFKVYGTANTGP